MKTVRNRPVRVGVVGCGVVADYGHIPAIDQVDNAELVAFADPDPERRNAQAEKYGKPAFESLAAMADAVELDAVSIPTHPGVKLKLVREAAKRGLHAFVEKPITGTVAQAEELVGLMDEAGLFVGVAFVYRGKQEVQRMMQLVREGAIGELRAVHIENMWDYHGLRSESWGQHYRGRRHRALKNMGTLDCGVHDLDLVRYFTGGDYAEVKAVGAIIDAANQYPDHLMIHARMNNGIIAGVEESGVWGYTATDTPRYQQSYRLVGENIPVTVRVLTRDYLPVHEDSITLNVTRVTDGETAAFSFGREPDKEGVFSGSIFLRKGTWNVQVTGYENEEPLVLDIRPPSYEYDKPAMQQKLLQAVAGASGGHFVSISTTTQYFLQSTLVISI